ncbi:MAG TPA: NAD(P)-dependent oxidoreductase [Candidatus Acidoferrales bacterium]|nr:NAD(P)-dependent oxidoreductase [Candidatus Acidoferrales bacterium]
MRVCVTGGTGFIGGALVDRLLRDGASVRVLARPSPRADELAARGVDLVRGDLGDSAAVERMAEGADVVFHAAALVEGNWAKEEFLAANLGGTQRVFEACIRQGVQHVVYLSSIAVYGLAQKGERIDELTPADGSPEKRDSYAQSKIEAEQYATAIGLKTRLAVTILRPGVVYGPRRPLPVALLGFQAGKTNVVFGRRRLRFPITYIDNLVDALLLAAKTDGSLRRYIVIDDDSLTLGQYHATRSAIDKTRAIFLPGWPLVLGVQIINLSAWFLPLGFTSQTAVVWSRQSRRALQDRWYNTSLIRKELGWTPRVPLREAIEKTAKSSK